ncbi:MAG: cyanophycin synthetase, partial [Azonexus sp.]
GKRGVTVADGRVVLRTGSEEIRLSRLVNAPYVGKAKQGKKIANVLAGIAAGWAMDLGKEVLTTGMKTFGIDLVDPAELIPQLAKKSQPAKKPAIARK